MTVDQVADYLQVRPATVRKKARQGLLPGAKIGRDWRFRKADLDAWLSAGGTRRTEPEEPDAIDLEMLREAKRRMEDPSDELIPYEQARAELGLR
jgi:excisionase family DNA binding protein